MGIDFCKTTLEIFCVRLNWSIDVRTAGWSVVVAVDGPSAGEVVSDLAAQACTLQPRRFVFQRSTSPQIRQLIFYYYQYEE